MLTSYHCIAEVAFNILFKKIKILNLACSRERNYANRHIILYEMKTVFIWLEKGYITTNLFIFQSLEKFKIWKNSTELLTLQDRSLFFDKLQKFNEK